MNSSSSPSPSSSPQRQRPTLGSSNHNPNDIKQVWVERNPLNQNPGYQRELPPTATTSATDLFHNTPQKTPKNSSLYNITDSASRESETHSASSGSGTVSSQIYVEMEIRQTETPAKYQPVMDQRSQSLIPSNTTRSDAASPQNENNTKNPVIQCGYRIFCFSAFGLFCYLGEQALAVALADTREIPSNSIVVHVVARLLILFCLCSYLFALIITRL